MKKIRNENFDPMLISMDELEIYAQHDEFLRGVFFARLSYKVSGAPQENLAGSEK